MSQELMTEIKKLSDEAHKSFHDLKGFQDRMDKELKGAVGRQDGLLTENSEKLASHIADVGVKIQSLQSQVAAMDAAKAEADQVKFYDGRFSLKASSKDAVALYNQVLRSGLTDNEKATQLHGLMQKDLVVNDNINGGFLVPTQVAGFIATRVFETSPIRKVANQVTIGSDSLTVPMDDQEFGAEWVSEAGSRNGTSNATLGELRIDAHEMAAKVAISLKMLEDATVNIEQWVNGKIADKFGRTENTAFVTGNGVGKPRGFLAYDAWASAGVYERNKLEQINSGSAAALTADGLINLQNSLVEAYQNGAVFTMNRNAYGKALLLKDSQNRYLFRDLPNSNGVFTPGLLEKPVIFMSDMPVVAANALSVAYGNFSMGYTIVDRVSMQLLRDPYTQTGFVLAKARKRVGGAVTTFDAIKIQKVAA